MVVALASSGRVVVAYDLDPGRRDALDLDSVQTMGSLQGVADAVETIILSLPSPEAAVSVCGELAPWPGLVLDTSTVGPSTSRLCAEILGGDRYCDSPILGRPDGVGVWTIPIGGSLTSTQRAVDTLRPLARHIVRMGDVGTAATLKVVNNMMFSAINAVTAEALVLARAAGLDPTTFVSLISESGAATVSGLFRDVAPRAVTGDYAPVFSLNLLAKDAGLALELAESLGVPVDVVRASQRLNLAGLAEGAGDLDTIAVVKALEAHTGVRVADQVS